MGSAAAFDGVLRSIVMASILLHAYVIHGAHATDRIVTIAELVLILQHHLLLIKVVLGLRIW